MAQANWLRFVCAIALLLIEAHVNPANAARRRSARKTPMLERPVLRFTANRSATVPNAEAFEPTPAMTIEVWLYKTTELVHNGRIVSLEISSAPGETELSYNLNLRNEDGADLLHFADFTRRVNTRAPFPKRVWVHVAVVIDGDEGTIYFDGSNVTAQSFTSPGTSFAGTRLLRVGGRGFSGAMRGLRFWRRALSEAELQTIVGGGQPASATDLIAQWPLDDGVGRIARDLGPNGLSLILPEINPGVGDPAPQWIRRDVLARGPYFELERFPREGGGGGANPGLVAMDATGDGLVDLLDLAGIPEGRLVCEYPYYTGAPPDRGDLWRNLGGGSFLLDSTLVQFEETHAYPWQEYVADFTGDERADLLILETGPEFGLSAVPCSPPGAPPADPRDFPGGKARLFVAQPGGGLIEETSTRLPQRRAYDHGSATGDVDGDGDRDIMLPTSDDWDLAKCMALDLTPGVRCPVIWLNDGHGNFSEDYTRLPEHIVTFREGSEARYYQAAVMFDADKDGDQDISLGGSAGSESFDPLLLNDGTGHFIRAHAGTMPNRPGAFGSAVVSIYAADFNRDDWPDLISTHYDTIALYLNNGNGTFRLANSNLPTGADLFGGFRCRPADLNGDGAPEIVCPYFDRLFFNRGDGTFEQMPPIDDFDISDVIQAADLDGDGDMDLVGSDGDALWVMFQRKPYFASPQVP